MLALISEGFEKVFSSIISLLTCIITGISLPFLPVAFASILKGKFWENNSSIFDEKLFAFGGTILTFSSRLIIDGGKYIGSKASSAIYNRRGSMTIEKGYFYSTTNCIDNNAALIINDVLMEGTNVGINNYDYVSIR